MVSQSPGNASRPPNDSSVVSPHIHYIPQLVAWRVSGRARDYLITYTQLTEDDDLQILQLTLQQVELLCSKQDRNLTPGPGRDKVNFLANLHQQGYLCLQIGNLFSAWEDWWGQCWGTPHGVPSPFRMGHSMIVHLYLLRYGTSTQSSNTFGQNEKSH